MCSDVTPDGESRTLLSRIVTPAAKKNLKRKTTSKERLHFFPPAATTEATATARALTAC